MVNSNLFNIEKGQSFLDGLAEERLNGFELLDNKGDHIEILDSCEIKCKVNFMENIDKEHLLSKLTTNVAHVCYMPKHTVFLAGLGAFSSMSCRKFRVNYKYGGTLPIGLYVMAEQPSGSSKSRVLNLFQAPFRECRKLENEERKEKLAATFDDDEKEELSKGFQPLFVSNTTPEALEKTLDSTGGYFAAISSEQGLVDTVFGNMYRDSKSSNNNDVALHGFDGGHHSSTRVTRDGYDGAVVGGIVVIAQPGTVDKILHASNGSGLAERFLLVSEEHLLGKRDFTENRFFDDELIDKYNSICTALYNSSDKDSINDLYISDNGFNLIAEYRNSIEADLTNGGKYSSTAIRGSASKIDMQIMKIGSNLHLLGCTGGFLNTISDDCIKDAITIASNMLEANLALCDDKGISGDKSEYDAIASLFENSNMPRTARNIIQIKSKTLPFKNMSFKNGVSKSQYIRDVLKNMLDDGVILASTNGKGSEVFVLS